MQIKSGLEHGFPYSLSRWTDVPGSKWQWFIAQMHQGCMIGFDPTTGVPCHWSLVPEDTLGLIFWTRDPANLVYDRELLRPYRVKVHVTVTGWHEVEPGSPKIDVGSYWLERTVKAFGAENVSWRFSPIPVLPTNTVLDRFWRILDVAAGSGLTKVYVSFLQPNDRIPEPRDEEAQGKLLEAMAQEAAQVGVKVLLCNESRIKPVNQIWSHAVCAPPEDFQRPNLGIPTAEGCGCVHMVDPFTINESCKFGCHYCYTSEKATSKHKRDTTKLPVLRG